MEELMEDQSFKKYQKLMTKDFVFENEEAENYANHFDDAIKFLQKI